MSRLTDPGRDAPTREERETARKAAWVRATTATVRNRQRAERVADAEALMPQDPRPPRDSR